MSKRRQVLKAKRSMYLKAYGNLLGALDAVIRRPEEVINCGVRVKDILPMLEVIRGKLPAGTAGEFRVTYCTASMDVLSDRLGVRLSAEEEIIHGIKFIPRPAGDMQYGVNGAEKVTEDNSVLSSLSRGRRR